MKGNQHREPVSVSDRTHCSGCSACAAVCPEDAVTMKPDRMGFRYPSVDASRCIGCGKCVDVCAFHQPETPPEPPVWSLVRYEAEAGRSQSGGAAFEAMRRTVSGGGVVYGVSLNADLQAVHGRAETLEDLEAFRGSKYIPSTLEGTFRQVRTDLSAGREVLFTGTPCQCAGLASFVGPALRNRLTLLDVICHGVAAPAVWTAFAEEQCRKAGGIPTSVRFRDPRFGWHSSKSTFSFDGKTCSSEAFLRLYLNGPILRPSCTACPFAGRVRPSDVTVGDAWGIEKTDHPLNDGGPVSLCIVSTEKGRRILPGLEPLDDPSPFFQASLREPCRPHPDAAAFERDFFRKGFAWASRKYGRKPAGRRLLDFYVKCKRFLLCRK